MESLFLYLKANQQTRLYLDMTLETGENSVLLLENSLSKNIPLTVVRCYTNPRTHQNTTEIAQKYNESLKPIKER